jgi:hypothetical protein
MSCSSSAGRAKRRTVYDSPIPFCVSEWTPDHFRTEPMTAQLGTSLPRRLAAAVRGRFEREKASWLLGLDSCQARRDPRDA